MRLINLETEAILFRGPLAILPRTESLNSGIAEGTCTYWGFGIRVDSLRREGRLIMDSAVGQPTDYRSSIY